MQLCGQIARNMVMGPKGRGKGKKIDSGQWEERQVGKMPLSVPLKSALIPVHLFQIRLLSLSLL
jgi:hypothetical protein